MSTTSVPARVTPSTKAATSSGDDGAHVVTDDDLRRAGERRERVADPARDGFVDLVGIDPANVIRLEDCVERHVPVTPVSPRAGSEAAVMVAPGPVPDRWGGGGGPAGPASSGPPVPGDSSSSRPDVAAATGGVAFAP